MRSPSILSYFGGMEIQTLLSNNQKWAAQMQALDPDFFSRLEHQQRPNFL